MPARPLRAYLWAFPTTCLGLLAALLTRWTGGRLRRRSGVLEVSGGFARRLLGSRLCRASAMTLGHVVLGRDEVSLESSRSHELGHVRQAERWGPLFLPAYVAASLWAVVTGGHLYYDNWFERTADGPARPRVGRRGRWWSWR